MHKVFRNIQQGGHSGIHQGNFADTESGYVSHLIETSAIQEQSLPGTHTETHQPTLDSSICVHSDPPLHVGFQDWEPILSQNDRQVVGFKSRTELVVDRRKQTNFPEHGREKRRAVVTMIHSSKQVRDCCT